MSLFQMGQKHAWKYCEFYGGHERSITYQIECILVFFFFDQNSECIKSLLYFPH